MATNRDVKMTLSVETLGADEIKSLKDEVLKLAKGAGDSAPEFEALAAEIDRIGAQATAVRTLQQLQGASTELGAAMQAAEAAFSSASAKLTELKGATDVARASQEKATQQTIETRDEIRNTENALKNLKERYTGVARETDAYTTASEQLRGKKAALQRALDDEVATLKAANSALSAAESEQKKQAAAVDRVADAYAKAEAASRKNAEAVSAAEGDLRGYGIAAENLAQAQAQVVTALNATGQAAQDVRAKLSATEAAARDLAEEDRLLAMQEKTLQAQRMQAHEERMGIEREYTAMVKRAAAERAAAATAELEKQKKEQEQLKRETASAAQSIEDAFSKVGIRSVKAITTEINDVRAAMQKVQAESGQTGSSLAAAMSAGSARIKELERELRAVNNELTTGDRAASLFKNSMGQIAAGNLVADAIGYMVGKVKELGAAFIQVNVQAESMKRGLTAIYGSADVAGQQMKALSGIASAAGVSVSGISDSFVRFSAATRSANIPLSQSNELFAAVTRASATLGLGADQTTRAIEALGQMASKGVVSMEELRQQLGDALPGALSRAAQGMGLTDAELIKLVESGRLATSDFFPGLTKGLQTLQGDTDGITQSWGRFKTALTTTAQAVGDAGFTNILTASLKLLGGALGLVVTILASFFEAITLGTKQVVALTSVITGKSSLSEALSFMGDEMAKSGERINRVTDSFAAMQDPTGEAAKRLQAAAGAANEVGAASTMTGAQVAELTAKFQQAAADSGKYAGASEAVAKANAILGDSSLDAGSKFNQLSVRLNELEAAKKKQIEVDQEGVKGAKAQAESISTLAQLRGDEYSILQSSVEANALVLAASRKEAESREALAGVLAVELKAKTDLSVSEYGSIEQKKIALQQIADKLAKADAEAKASREEVKNLETTTAVLQVKSKAYADNSAAIDELRKTSELANATLEAVRKQFEAGNLSAAAYGKAQLDAAAAAAMLKDAEKDKAKAIEASTKSKLVDNTVAQSGLAMSLELAKEQAANAKRLGDEVGYRQAVIRQKEIEIQIDKLKVEAQKLEALGSIAVAQAKMGELEVSDPLYQSKKAEYEATIKLAQAKLKLVDAQKQAIDARQQELERQRSGAQALGGETTALGSNTSARHDNTRAIDASTSARERAIAAAEKELNLKEREAAVERKRKGVDENGFAADAAGKTITQEMPTWLSIFNQLKSRGLPDDVARQVAGEFTDSKGEVAYFDNPGQRKYANGDKSVTLGAAVDRAAGNWLRNQTSPQQANPQGGQTNSTRTININIGGQQTSIRVASDADADALTRLIQLLTQYARTAA